MEGDLETISNRCCTEGNNPHPGLTGSLLRLAEPGKKGKNSIKKKRVEHNRMIRELDADARQRVFERDGYCVRCGATSDLQWSHVHSRRHHCLRWDEDNSKVLCRACHCWWTNNPGLAFDFFAKKWPERWQRITRILQANPKVRVKDKYEELCPPVIPLEVPR